jgi:hypothetical protein
VQVLDAHAEWRILLPKLTWIEEVPFVPLAGLERESLKQRLVAALEARAVHPVPPADAFTGAGVYAIYFTGQAVPVLDYAHIAAGNINGIYTRPIYVGKAEVEGGRKGQERDEAKRIQALRGRLMEHARSINGAANLDIEDFRCRYLVVEMAWVRICERLLIEHYHPIWNEIVDGFGNHAPGGGRGEGERPRWDTIHSSNGLGSRAWAATLPDNRLSAEEIWDMVRRASRGQVRPDEKVDDPEEA